MAIEKIKPSVVDSTKDFVFGNVTVTGNITTSNANLGNIATANYVAGTLTTAIQSNITSVGTLGNLTVTSNIAAGNIKTNNLLYANGVAWSMGTVTTVAGTNTEIQFNDAGSFGASSNLSFDKTTNTLTVTNLVTNGSGITNLTASNVVGQVGNALVAATVYTNAQPNITSIGTLTSLIVTGNVTSGNASLGNTVTANYFSGSGNLLSNIQGGNVTGEVSFAATANAVAGANVSGPVTYAATANAVAGANVFGQVGNSLVSGTVYTNAQPNITSVGTLTNLSVTGNVTAANFIGDGSQLTGITATSATTATTANYANFVGSVVNSSQPNITSTGTLSSLTISGITTLGNVGNVKISGGSANFVLQTDGTGNLVWVEPASSIVTVGDVTIDNFTGNGTQTAFTLSVNPGDIKYVAVNIDGVSQLRQAYSVSSTTLTFSSAPANGALIEVSITVPGTVASAGTVTTAAQPNITSLGTLTSLNLSGNITGNLLPSANVTYNLGSPTQRWKDLYLSNSTIYLGETPFSSANVFPFNLVIAPEVLEIQIAAPDAGSDITWLWTWVTSTLPYARTTITNSPQVSVPMYKKGLYQLNNFANEQTGEMTQRHGVALKWIDGAGSQNNVSWAVSAGNVSMTHPDISGGASTLVQRYNISVPEVVTPPTLVAPIVSYSISAGTPDVYTIASPSVSYSNKNLGPVRETGTYTFNLASDLVNDPLYLTTDNGTNWVANAYFGEYTTGVTGSRNNGSVGKTTLVFTVPVGAPTTLYYQSATTFARRGAITIKPLAVETNIDGNYVLYIQHGGEGHKTPIEIRPIPSLVNQMCVVYDASVGKFVPQDLATYVENTPSFKNKIREVAGTATLVAGDGVVVVPSVTVVEDPSYLPLVGNKMGDISYTEDSDTIYLWNGTQWRDTKAVVSAAPPVYVNLNMPGSITAPFTGTARYYPGSTIVITTVYANLGAIPSGNFTFVIKKNGVSIGTTFTMSGVVMTPVSVNVTLTTSDYLTLDITGVNGSDLSIKLKYTY
jgi:hypothetical protein